MKRGLTILLFLFGAPGLLFLSACNPDGDDGKPKDYPADEFIFNTFLFEPGTWWAFYDSVTQEYDTITVTSGSGGYQNVYEGDKFLHKRYYYTGQWVRSKNLKTYNLQYRSESISDWKGKKVPRIDISTYDNHVGSGREALFFGNTLLTDTLPAGVAFVLGSEIPSKFVLEETGDQLFHQNAWHTAPYVKYKLVKSATNNSQDLVFIFQKYTGMTSHTIEGKYRLVDNHLLPMKQ